MSKLEIPFVSVEAPGPILVLGIAIVVAGSVMKHYIRAKAYNAYVVARSEGGYVVTSN